MRDFPLLQNTLAVLRLRLAESRPSLLSAGGVQSDRASVSMSSAAALFGLLSCVLAARVCAESSRSKFGSRSDGTADLIHSPSGSDYLLTESRMEPLFDPSTPRNITIASGKTAYLPCRVRHLGERTVSRRCY